MTSIRIRISDGEKLPPSGLDPYMLPWVKGADETVNRYIREKYKEFGNKLRPARVYFDPSVIVKREELPLSNDNET